MTQHIQIITDPENYNNIEKIPSAQVLVVTDDLYYMKIKTTFYVGLQRNLAIHIL